MIVVADTSPLNYLIQINAEILLSPLYGRILVPHGVLQEMAQSGAPKVVREWAEQIPAWIDICSPLSEPDPSLSRLGIGEREAIQLAMERGADLLLIDERKGRLEASTRGITTTGTLGVLLTAGKLGLIDPAEAYRKLLTETTFRTSAELEAHFLALVRQI